MLLSSKTLIHIDNFKNPIKKVKNKTCWFCERKCDQFVSICESCKIDRKLCKKNKN
jgi:hypothetical protein